MKKGTVKVVFQDRGFGFITPAEPGPDVHFRRSACPTEFAALRKGTEVEYEAEEGIHKGTRSFRAVKVWPVRITSSVGASEDAATQHRRSAAFVNPYSFVRWLPRPASETAESMPLWGKAEGPPHDRYIGLTGTLECFIIVETDTFVADSHDVTPPGGDKVHKKYESLRGPDGRPVIPGSTLRGVLRTVYEAVTDSCFIKMNREEVYGKRGDRNYVKPKRQVGELIPSHLQPCSTANALCPACRLFGWVSTDENATVGAEIAYRGRIRISDAVFQAAALERGSRTLQILSTPKPDYVWFYLMKGDGTAPDGRTERSAGYGNVDNRIRGRKLYWHQAELAENATPRENQNRTIRSWLKPGSETSFTIHFANLAPAELGALLWCIEIEGEHVHRLGYGKPLGYGSVWLATDRENSRMLAADRYAAGALDGWRKLTPEHMRMCITEFQRQMVRRHTGSEPKTPEEVWDRFKQLRNIADLRSILYSGAKRDIMYPALPGGGGSYKWFSANEQGKKFALPGAHPGNSLPRNPR